ncbi:MAG: hypothetical protein ACE5GY_06545 [Thermodesulfobacteriota bacterium]
MEPDKATKRALIMVFTLFATMMLISPTSARAQTKLKNPVVQPGPGSITSGYNAWNGGYGTCRAVYWIAGKHMGQTVFEGDIINGSITYKDADGKNQRISGNVAVVYRDGVAFAYKCMSKPREKTPPKTPKTPTGGRHPYDRMQR